MIEMGFETTILNHILHGEKTVEGRLRTGKFITVRKGDRINLREDFWENDRIVRSIPNRATVTVTSTQIFDSFAAMLAAVPLQDVLPSAASIDEALKMYRQFYTASQEREQGVVAVGFTLGPRAGA